jgi:hypothetical protein
MKVLITENKITSLYQRFINECLMKLKLMDEGDTEWEDWVDREVLDNINAVDSIKVNNVEKIVKDYAGITLTIFEVHVSTLLDSHRYLDCFQIYYNIEHYLKRTIFDKSRDFKVKIIEDNIELKDKDPQW